MSTKREPCQAESLPPARPTRMMVALLAFISRATALIEAPSSSRCSAFARPSSVSTAGRPNFFPSALARACPANVTSDTLNETADASFPSGGLAPGCGDLTQPFWPAQLTPAILLGARKQDRRCGSRPARLNTGPAERSCPGSRVRRKPHLHYRVLAFSRITYLCSDGSNSRLVCYCVPIGLLDTTTWDFHRCFVPRFPRG
jgi:hypothetical protein